MSWTKFKRDAALFGGIITAIGIAGASVSPQQRGGPQPTRPAVDDNRATVKDLEQWMTSLSNWGRWGPDDEVGAVNLITPRKRQSAAKLVQTGTEVSLMRGHTIIPGAAGNPFTIVPSVSPGGFASDRIEVSFHGQQITHMDALCHFSHNGKAYNGFPFETVITPARGCMKLGIGNVKDRIFTRGVLVDMPRLKGLPYLEPGTHVMREDVEAWEKRAGIRIGPGDAVFLRTGRWARDAKLGPSPIPSGYDLSFVPFFKERDIAVIGSDWTHDVGTIIGVQYPVHHFAIVALGMTLLDNVTLEELADKAATLNRWEFLLTVAPASALNGTGAPVNPVAIF